MNTDKQIETLKNFVPEVVTDAFNSAVEKIAAEREADLTHMEKISWQAVLGYPLR